MDPDANLREQLRIAKRFMERESLNGDAEHDGHRLAELVLALHEWIAVKRGFLPEPWEVKRYG